MDRSQTACDRLVSHFCPHFTATAAPFGFHLQIQQAYVVSARSEKHCCRFFVPPPSQELPGTVATAAAADPVDFEAMAAERNRCTETQHLLSGSSLKLAFRQAGTQCLVGNVSMGVFHPIIPAKFRKDIFCICTAFPILGG